MDISNILAQLPRYVQENGQRYGQALHNLFHKQYHHITIPDEVDCFYDNKKVSLFIDYVSNLEP
jgi:hypothetical protein